MTAEDPMSAGGPEASRHRDDESLRRELVVLAREHPERQLLQMASRISARQYRDVHRAVRRFLAPGALVLDWGAGNGHFSYFLLRAGFRATGYCVDAPVAADWLGPLGWSFVQGDPAEPTRLPFDDDAFDAVASIGVLEHVHETGGRDRDSLAELVRVLRPGGYFICCHLPNETSWIEAVSGRLGGVHHHDVRYRVEDVRALLAGAGLELVESRRYGFLPRNFWSRLPAWLSDAAAVGAAWDAADAALEQWLPRWTQNHLVVARLPDAP